MAKKSKKPVLASIEISNDWTNSDLNKNYTIWIGHSTFIIKKVDDLTILLILFFQIEHLFKRFGPKRLIPPQYKSRTATKN